MGTSDFTNLLDTEIRRSMPPARDFNPRRVLQKQSRKMLPARDLNNTGETSDSFRECSWRRSSAHTTLSVVEVPSAAVCWATRMVQLSTTLTDQIQISAGTISFTFHIGSTYQEW